MSDTGDAGTVSLVRDPDSSSLSSAKSTSEPSSGSSKKEVSDSPSLALFQRLEIVLSSLGFEKLYSFSTPAVGGGVSGYKIGGGVVDRSIVVFVLVTLL
jgi:hypothetical protein